MLVFKQINDIDFPNKRKRRKKINSAFVKEIKNNDFILEIYGKIADRELLMDSYWVENDDSFLDKVRRLARSAREEEIDFISH